MDPALPRPSPKAQLFSPMAGQAEGQILLLPSLDLCDVCRDSSYPSMPGLQLCWALGLGRKSHFMSPFVERKGKKELQVFSPSAGQSWGTAGSTPHGGCTPCVSVTPGPP